MNSFELVQIYGASTFVVYKFLEENPNVTVLDIQLETGLSDNCIKNCLEKLMRAKLLNRVHGFLNKSKGYRYSTTRLQ
jgi:predicted transcriptional regulator